jgi:NADH-quinone oxidoreductase subunit A
MTDSMVPVVLLIGIATLTAGSMVVLSFILGRPRRSGVDTTPYECGIRPFERVSSHRFSVHFYLVAMLFILFDIEVVFLYPVGVIMKAAHSVFVLVEIIIFVVLLLVALVYVWRRGALNWR